MRTKLLLATILAVVAPILCEGAENSSRFIVKRREHSATQSGIALAQTLHNETGVALHWRRGRAGENEVFESASSASAADIQRALHSLQNRSDVEYAAIDQRRHAHAIPSDSLFSTQWYLQSVETAAIQADAAWELAKGSSTVVVAVLDTGVRFDHPDLQGKLLPGYDFVSGDTGGGFLAANDGDGRDADPSDPGDWIDSADLQKPTFANDGCGGGPNQDQPTNSSWHGTRVAGMIAAATDNGVGIAGVGWNTMILPVRVMGKCGGFDSDILDAMKWAAGIDVTGVPHNQTPAKIINLSLGGPGTCSAAYQSVIQQLAARGVVVVVSAGNEGGPVDEPADCPGAIGVAGLRQAGTKVGYSSLGPEISIAAPAGNCVNSFGACLFSLTTTVNTGLTQPVAAAAGAAYTDQFNTNLGTSFSAPLAAGVAALMFAANDKLTAAQIRTRMMEGASAFPAPGAGIPLCHAPIDAKDLQQSECGCTTGTCGAGMLNARGAVAAAMRPIVNVVLPGNVAANANVTLDASATTTALNRTLSSYSWSLVTACNTTSPTLGAINQSTLEVTTPTSGSYTLMLRVTDSLGATDTTDIVVTNSSATVTSAPPTCTPPAAPANGGSSGGGAADWCFIAGCAAFQLLRRRRTNYPVHARDSSDTR